MRAHLNNVLFVLLLVALAFACGFILGDVFHRPSLSPLDLTLALSGAPIG